MEVPFPFEFVVAGIPLSLGASAKSKAAWKERVKDAASAHLPEGHFAFEGPLEVHILYFPPDRMEGDIDNIVKPILDAMCKFIYLDDAQIVRVTVEKIEPGRAISFVDPSIMLVEALEMSKPCVYIRLANTIKSEISL